MGVLGRRLSLLMLATLLALLHLLLGKNTRRKSIAASPSASAKTKMGNDERTFIMIKPDGVQRGLCGDIIKRFEQKGFKLVAMKFMQASEDHLKMHYADLSSKPFFAGLVKYMASGPVLAMVWEGLNVVATGRVMLGETNPKDSKPGTIRGDFSSRSAATSATARTPSTRRRRRSRSGSSPRSSSAGSRPPSTGSTSRRQATHSIGCCCIL